MIQQYWLRCASLDSKQRPISAIALTLKYRTFLWRSTTLYLHLLCKLTFNSCKHWICSFLTWLETTVSRMSRFWLRALLVIRSGINCLPKNESTIHFSISYSLCKQQSLQFVYHNNSTLNGSEWHFARPRDTTSLRGWRPNEGWWKTMEIIYLSHSPH